MVARCSAEAEYRVIALGICELMWFRTLLEDMDVTTKRSMQLLANDLVQHDRKKHIEIDRHFIKKKVN